MSNISIDNFNELSPLRVTFLSHSSFKEHDEIDFFNLIKKLVNKNVQCHVILSEDGWLSEELLKLSVSVDIIDFPLWIYNVKDFYQNLWDEIIVSSAKIADIVSKKLPDIIFTNSIYIPQGAFVASFFKIPHIWHITEYDETIDNTIFLLEISDRSKFIYDYSDKIIFNSELLQSIFNQFISSNKSISCSQEKSSREGEINYYDNIYNSLLNIKLKPSLDANLVNIFKEMILSHAHLSTQFTRLNDQYNHLNDQYNQLNDQHNQLNDQHQKIQYENDENKRTIASMIASKSWKITVPLRQIDAFKRQIYNFASHKLDNVSGKTSVELESSGAVQSIEEKPSISIEHIHEIHFPDHPSPMVSIIIPVYNKWEYTYACLKSIRERFGRRHFLRGDCRRRCLYR